MAAEPWPVVELERIADRDRGFVGGPFGSSLGRRDYTAQGVPVVRGTNLASGTARFDDAVFVSAEKADSLSRCVAVPGDIVVTQRGTLGQVAVLTDEFPRYLISQSQMALRVDTEVGDLRYVLFAMRAPGFRQQIDDRAIVTGVPHLNLGIFKAMSIPLPPPPYQRAIASVLGALDDKIESNRRAAAAAEAVWLTTSSRALGGAAQIPVADLIATGALVVNDGYRAKNAELADAGIPFVRAGNLTADGLVLDDVDLVPPAVVSRAAFKVAYPWDTAFTSKGTVGRITLVGPRPDPFVYSPQVCFWRSTRADVLSPLVLHAWMRSPRFTAQIDAVKGQTDMADYVSLRDQRAMVIDVPTEDTQREAHEIAEPMATLAWALRREARTLGSIRDALLPKLVSGQIRVPLSKDPDEMVGPPIEAHEAEEAA
jgi:type I restriction enzyme, S subunit